MKGKFVPDFLQVFRGQSPMPPLDLIKPNTVVPLQFQQAADRIHLVHVTHRLGRPASLLEGLAASAAIPDSSAANGYCGDGARFVEDQCHFPRSVYFYAGRVCPTYGGAALAFPPESERGRTHSAAPFDTGGVVKSDPTKAFALGLNPADLPSRVRYCQQSTAQASAPPGWRSRFAEWLAVYYPQAGPEGYWSQRPEVADPEGLYTRNDDWRAWAWEVRFTVGPRVLEAEMWTANPATVSSLRHLVTGESVTPVVAAGWGDFWEKLLTPAGDDDYCTLLEEEVIRRC